MTQSGVNEREIGHLVQVSRELELSEFEILGFYCTTIIIIIIIIIIINSVKYHSRIAELIANKKGESYSSTISWIKAKVYLSPSYTPQYCAWGAQDPEDDS